MEDKLEFFILEKETIPTRLCLKKGDIMINYEHLKDDFGYKFELFNLKENDSGAKIINEIVSKMCRQSYDHGAEWRVENIELLEQQFGYAKWNVKFYIKDSY